MSYLTNIVNSFKTEGELLYFEPYGEGHIHDTYFIKTTKQEYILQKINKIVFSEPDKLMENIKLVTEFLKNKSIITLDIIETINGQSYLFFEGNYYRIYAFLADSISYNKTEDYHLLENLGVGYSKFLNSLEDLNTKLLHETIVDFHNARERYQKFQSIIMKENPRIRECQNEILFIKNRFELLMKISDSLRLGIIPERVTHNDTKLSNLLFTKSNKPLCVIDLDTVMPGSILFDYGDALRACANTASEDEDNLMKVKFNIRAFEAFTKGFLKYIQLTEDEVYLLPYASIIMTLENGMRFLIDFLENDVYFKTSYEKHNLVRARNQFKLVESMESHIPNMKKIITQLIVYKEMEIS